jgi:hypothetical protein
MAAKYELITSFRDRTQATTPPRPAQSTRNRIHIRDDALGGVLIIAPHGCFVEINDDQCCLGGIDGLEGV